MTLPRLTPLERRTLADRILDSLDDERRSLRNTMQGPIDTDLAVAALRRRQHNRVVEELAAAEA